MRNKNDHTELELLSLGFGEQTITRPVSFVSMPVALSDELFQIFHLEYKIKGKIFNENYNFPINDFKNAFLMKLPKIVDMKPVSKLSENKNWIVSLEPVDLSLVINALKLWMKQKCETISSDKDKMPQADTLLSKIKTLEEEINEAMFLGCHRTEDITLIKNGLIHDNLTYTIIPLLLVNQMTGMDFEVNGIQTKWMYSGKNELMTDPMDITGGGSRKDHYSYTVRFKIDTIPEKNTERPYLNIHPSVRKIVSNNKSEEIPYISDKKTVFFRVSDTKLFRASAVYKNQNWQWVGADMDVFQMLYGKLYNSDMAGIKKKDFSEIIRYPHKYMCKDTQDAYVVFEYGMRTGDDWQMSEIKSGLSHSDRTLILEFVKKAAENLFLESCHAKKILGIKKKSSIQEYFFDDDMHEFELEPKLTETLRKNLETICEKKKKITFEICHDSAMERYVELLTQKLREHFSEFQDLVSIEPLCIAGLSEPLAIKSSKDGKKKAPDLVKKREEILRYLGEEPVDDVRMSIVVIHDARYYRTNGGEMTDVKPALRNIFLETGRLTKFVTVESIDQTQAEKQYLLENPKKKMSRKLISYDLACRETLLGAYSDLGICHPLKNNKNHNLNESIIVGIHLLRSERRTDKKKTRMKTAIPIIVSINPKTMEETVETYFILKDTKQTEHRHICCKYCEFPIEFNKVIKEAAKKNQEIYASKTFIQSWSMQLDQEETYLVIADSNTKDKTLLHGIMNQMLTEEYDESCGQIPILTLNQKEHIVFDLKEAGNVNFLRIRTNDEVPDYTPPLHITVHKDKTQDTEYQETSGIFQFRDVYYSKDEGGSGERKLRKLRYKAGTNTEYSHKNLIEIYPIYVPKKEETDKYVASVHCLRDASLTFSQKTVLPLPLHLAKRLEKYILE